MADKSELIRKKNLTISLFYVYGRGSSGTVGV
jgi:hypothetical protein